MSMLPPILVELIGDESKLTASLGKVSKNLDKLSKDGATTSEKLKAAAGPIAGAFGVAASAAGAALEHLSGQSEKAHAELEQAITNSGHDFADYSGQIDAAVSHMEHFGHSGADTQEALAKLTTALGDPKKALDEMGLAADYAAMKHVSLADAAGVLAKASAGSGKAFKEFGIDIKTAGDGTAAMAAAMTPAEVKAAHVAAAMGELAQKIHGQAEAAAHTFSGELSSLRAHLTDIAAGVGEKVVPALTIMGPLLMGIASVAKLETTPALLSMASAAAAVVAPLALVAAAGYAITQAFHDHAKAINASGAALKSMTQTDMQDYIAKVEEAHKANSDLFKPSDFQKDFNSALSDSVQTAQMFVDALAASGHNVDTYNEQLARANQSQGFNNQLAAEGVGTTEKSSAVTAEETKAKAALKAAIDAQNQAMQTEAGIMIGLLGSEDAYKKKQEDATIAVAAYTAALSDSKKTEQDRIDAEHAAVQALDAVATGAVTAAEDTAKLHGETLTATQKTAVYIDSLNSLALTLAPNSPLRAVIQGVIDKLNSIPNDITINIHANADQASLNALTGKTTNNATVVGMRAAGGPVQSGDAYIVGEQGPEVLQMGSTSGNIIPNNQLGSSTAAPVEVTLMLDGSVLARVLTPHLRNVQRALS